MLLYSCLLLPVAGGALIPFLPFGGKIRMHIYTLCVTAATSLLLACALIFAPSAPEMSITDTVTLCLRADSASRIFGALIAVLWPLAALYGFGYMRDEGSRDENRFFAFYTVSYGVTIGIACAGNLATLYIFYETLTLATLPLVTYKRDRAAVHAGRTYLYYSIGGAALAFTGLLYIAHNGPTDFVFGGHGLEPSTLTQVFYLMTVIGFGAKAAMIPLHAWLPRVSVAPTPVTALLHAVAVVKAGVFAVMRVTFYSFGSSVLGCDLLRSICIALAALTIVYGSVRALRERHMKRRLAWSTVSNLSYILLGLFLGTKEGMAAAMQHMLYHGAIKITLFLCIGAVQMLRHSPEYPRLNDMDGLAKRMPFTSAAFTLAACALCGIPPLAGFASKWNLASASLNAGCITGAVALIISAVCTACYLMPVVVRMYFRPAPEGADERVHEDMRIVIPLMILCAVIIALSFTSGALYTSLTGIAG